MVIYIPIILLAYSLCQYSIKYFQLFSDVMALIGQWQLREIIQNFCKRQLRVKINAQTVMYIYGNFGRFQCLIIKGINCRYVKVTWQLKWYEYFGKVNWISNLKKNKIMLSIAGQGYCDQKMYIYNFERRDKLTGVFKGILSQYC